MNYEKYLPLGSIVMLKGGKKRLMVTGFCINPNEDPSKIFDYSGVIFPEGMISSDQTALFNHDQIERIDYLGLIDEEEKMFKIKLNELINHELKEQNEKNNNPQEQFVDIPILAQQSNNSENSDIETL